jgi:hypothetical protein
MVSNDMQWPIEKTHQVIWNALHDYDRMEWKRTLKPQTWPTVGY